MPTSSIFTNVVITDPVKAENFVKVLEEAYLDSLFREPITTPKIGELTDSDEIGGSRSIINETLERKCKFF